MSCLNWASMPGLMRKRPMVPYMMEISSPCSPCEPGKARYQLRRDLVENVERIFHWHMAYVTESRLCTQFAHFRLRDTDSTQSFPMIGQRSRHAVEHADTV